MKFTKIDRRGGLGFALAIGILALALSAVVMVVVDLSGRPAKGHDANAFFEPLRRDGDAASESRFYGSIAEMTKASSLVVRARVVDVVHTRTIRSSDESGLSMIGIKLSVTSVTVGSMVGDTLIVEFLGGSGKPDGDIRDLRAAMPDGESLWFLRSGRDSVADYRKEMSSTSRAIPFDEESTLEQDLNYHWLISSQGLYIQGLEHVVNPLANEEHQLTALYKEAEAYGTLAGLASKAKASR